MKKTYFLDMEPAEIGQLLIKSGCKNYRLNQIFKWVYKKRIETFSACSDLPEELRKHLDKTFYLRSLTITEMKVSNIDGAVRYSFSTQDGLTVTSAFLPQANRNTICLSTQIGCPIRCSFCASGQVTFKRNLSRGEIIEQVFQIEKDTKKTMESILFMGMGEPLLNYENVLKAIRSFTDTNQFAYGRKKIILSTVGIVDKLRKLAGEKINIRLALSLHAPDDKTRKILVPGKVPFSVNEILKAGLEYTRKSKSRLTIEYVLIAGTNDSLEYADALEKLLKKLINKKDRIKINLIAYNPTGLKNRTTPKQAEIIKFKDYLTRRGILTIIRKSMGTDIGAACGQLTIV